MDKFFIEKISSLPEKIDLTKIYNINVGILGHIDSGKTSLSKALSTVASTASFDKNPQSQERGITLDLGFSAFYINTPSFIKEKFPKNERLCKSEIIQITLVDCPGHASLIRTVIAGASIIDIIVLVIDIVKGIQVQTTECLILGEILVENIVVALNKIDTISQEKRSVDVENRINKLKSAFSNTKFGKDVCVCPVSASPKVNENFTSYLDNLIYHILDKTNFYKRNFKDKFLFSIDHCFNIKNKGTIITGTILQGKVVVNDEIFFPTLSEKKMVKEIQMFKKSTTKAYQGDRVGMLMKNLDHTKIERSLACTENYVQNLEGGIYLIKKIKYYKQEIKSNSKLFLIAGNQGVMAKCLFFDLKVPDSSFEKLDQIDNYKFNYNKEYLFNDNLEYTDYFTFAYLKFDNKLLLQNDMIVLGSKIDFDVSYKSNRIAFYGKMIDNISMIMSKLKIYKIKVKQGKILRLQGSNKNAIVIGLFKKDSNIEDFIGKTILIKNSNITGVIQSKFGQSGKVKVEFSSDVNETKIIMDDKVEVGYQDFIILLEFKKFIKY